MKNIKLTPRMFLMALLIFVNMSCDKEIGTLFLKLIGLVSLAGVKQG